MGWIGCVRCEKFRCDFKARTCALIAPVQPVLYWGSCSNETIQNTSKHYETHQNMSSGATGWIGSLRCKKIWCNFVAQTFALIAPVQPVLQLASCSNKKNPKCSQKQWDAQKMSLGSNGMDRVHSFRKIPMRLRGTNFCINYTSSTCFATSFV